MSEYLNNAAGVTTTTGASTSGLVISNSIDQYGPIIGAAVNGATYPYYIKYVDVADGVDYETGQATWDSGTNTLTSTGVTTSSNAGLAVNWGPGQKAVFITADAALSTDMEQMVNGSTKFYLTSTQAANIAASKTKTDLITVTQAVNLDTMESDIAALASGMTYKGNWDASTNVFPGGGTASIGDFYYVNVGGTVDTVEFTVGDNIVAITNNASISQFSGYWSKHDQTDAVQSVAGLVGTIQPDDLRIAIYVDDVVAPAGLAYSAETSDVIFLIMWGDSQVGGWSSGADPTLLPMVNNNSVYVWSTVGSGASPQVTANCAWRNQDPNATAVTDWGPGIWVPYFGIPRAGLGSTGYFLADLVQKATRKTVCLLQYFAPGTTMTDTGFVNWKVGGGLQTALAAAVAACKIHASTPAGFPDVADAMISMIGVNDLEAVASEADPEGNSQDFLTDMTAFIDEAIADGWINTTTSRIYNIEPAQTPVYVLGKWLGAHYVNNTQGDRVKAVSSVGMGLEADNLHFSGDSLNQFARPILSDWIAGPTLRDMIRPNNYVSQIAPIIKADFDANYFDANNVDRIQLRGPNTGNVTYTSNPLATIGTALDDGGLINKIYYLNYVGNIPSVVAVPAQAQYIFQQASGGVTTAFLNIGPNIGHAIAGATATLGSYNAIDYAPIYASSTTPQAITTIFQTDCAMRPVYSNLPGGSTWATTLHTHYSTSAAYGTGHTVSWRIGFLTSNATGGGTVTYQVGFATDVSGGTNNCGLLLGGSLIAFSGNYGIYQNSTTVNRWGGGHRYAYRAISGSGNQAVTVADHIIKVTTTTAPVTLDLPTAVGNTGLEYIIKRTGTQSVTVEPNGAQSIDGVGNYVIGTADQLCHIVSDGANWLAIHLGAP